MVESRSVYRKFYEDFIGVGQEIVEIRIHHLEKQYMFSLYVRNFKELLTIFKKYDKHPFNIYYGINSREVEGKKKEDIKYRRVFYFDIEKDGKKPCIEEDEEYKNQLVVTSLYICKKLKELYDLDPSALVQSGRGYHLYYLHEPLLREEYENKFRDWWKNKLIPQLEKEKIYKDIKFSDSMFNISRIASAPGTRHQKYDDRPFRKIIKFKPIQNNIKHILDNIKEKKYVQTKILIKKENLLKEPVFKILKKEVPMNEGYQVNNVLMFSASLLCRDAGLNEREVLEVDRLLEEWGYWSGCIIIPSKEYNYNKNTINNWCFNNAKWCLEKKFKLPYEFLKTKIKYEINDEEKEFEDRELNDIWELLKYTAEFNKQYFKINRGVRIIYKKSLLEKLKKNCNPILKEFIEMNNLWNKICLYCKGVEVRL
jgi:hypothetical protein